MNRSIRFACLMALLAVAFAYESRNTWDIVQEIRGEAGQVARPFGRSRVSGRVGAVGEAAGKTGLKTGDVLLEVQGLPFTGTAVLERVLRTAKPGGTLKVKVDQNGPEVSGGEAELDIPLASVVTPRAERWAMALITVAMPWLCLLAGFWVAFVRSEDRRAWLFLFLMVTFARLIDDPPWHWPAGWREFGTVWQGLTNGLWPIAMFLFGISFPEPLPFDRKWPRLKLVPIAIVAAYAVLVTLSRLDAAEHPDAPAALGRFVVRIGTPMTIVGIVMTSLFFMGLGLQHARSLSPDERRRLILLQTGTTVAMAPAFVLTLLALVQGRDFSAIAPSWVVFTSFSFVFLFPVTMAYVVVVQRALDVRVVVRQGVRYALARGTVRVVQVVVSVAAIALLAFVLRNPAARNVEIVGALAAAIAVIVWLERFARWLNAWLDRKFFREAVDTERVLLELADEVRTVVETGTLVDTVARKLAASLHVARVSVLLPVDGFLRVAYAVGETASTVIPEGGPTAAHELNASEPLRVYPDDPRSWTNDPRTCAPAERAALVALGTQLLLPLSAKQRLLGLISLGPKRSEEPYSTADVKLLRSVATQTGLALENARLTAAVAAETAQRTRLAREVEIAREVQQRLFPQVLPEVPRLELAGFCRPALQVGGDYYDFLSLADGSLAFAVGDVSGKGIGAALLMASLQAALRSQRLGAGGLAEAVDNVNRIVHATSPDNRYATLFVGRFDPATRRLTYVNAGHNAPILFRHASDGEANRLKATGPVVGLLDAASWKESEIGLSSGDLLVGYSDGISEAMTSDDEEWGEQRLAAAIAACDGCGVAEIITRVFAAADAFTAGAAQHDDMTLIVLRCR